jgi:hypothetical protein
MKKTLISTLHLTPEIFTNYLPQKIYPHHTISSIYKEANCFHSLDEEYYILDIHYSHSEIL